MVVMVRKSAIILWIMMGSWLKNITTKMMLKSAAIN